MTTQSEPRMITRTTLLISWHKKDGVVKATVGDQLAVPEFDAKLVQQPAVTGALFFLNPTFSLATVGTGRLIFTDEALGDVMLSPYPAPANWQGAVLDVNWGYENYIRLERLVRTILERMTTAEQKTNAKASILLQLVTNEQLYNLDKK